MAGKKDAKDNRGFTLDDWIMFRKLDEDKKNFKDYFYANKEYRKLVNTD